MDVEVDLADLYHLHKELEWRDLITAAAIVLGERTAAPFRFGVEIVDVPSFDDDALQMTVHANNLDVPLMAKLRRTIEPPRLVELAAIALAGLAVYHAGGLEIVGVAAQGTGVDYLLGDDAGWLEVTGRSRRRDFESAWGRHWSRLTETVSQRFFLFAAEFQTSKGRLAYQP